MKKKLLALLLAIMVLMSAVPMIANAEETVPVTFSMSINGEVRATDVDLAVIVAAVNTSAATESNPAIITVNQANASVSLSGMLQVTNPFIFEGNGATVTGSSMKTFEVYANATFRDLTIVNNYNSMGARAIDVRANSDAKNIVVNLENVHIKTPNGYNSQSLNIGGDAGENADEENRTVVNMVHSSIETNTSGYGIMTFNPVDLTIDNSSITAWSAIYMKLPNGSFGSKGSCVGITYSDLVSTNPHSAVSNSFSMFTLEDNNIELVVDKHSTISVSSTGDQDQAIVNANAKMDYDTNEYVPTTGNVIIIDCPITFAASGDATTSFVTCFDADSNNTISFNADCAVSLTNAGYVLSYDEETELVTLTDTCRYGVSDPEDPDNPDKVIWKHHNIDEFIEVGEDKAPTCTEPGSVKKYACNLCNTIWFDEDHNIVTTDVIPAKGHTTTKTPAKDATCTEKGNVEYYTCSECSKVFKDAEGTVVLTNVEVATKAHTLTKTPAKEATCLNGGNVEYYTCSACSKVFKDAEGTTVLTTTATPKKAHVLTKVSEKAATYTEAGKKEHYACSGCSGLFADAEGNTIVTAASLFIPTLIQVEENKTEEKIEVKVEVTTETVDKAVEAAKQEEKKEVVINLDKVVEDNVSDDVAEKAEITAAEIPVASLEQVKDLGEDAVLTVQKNDVTVEIDAKTLETIASTAKEEEKATITLEVTKEAVTDIKKTEELKDVQKEAVADKKVVAVISASITAGNKEVHDFKGGEVKVSIPFTPEEGTKGEDYVVLYISDDGKVEEIKTTYKDGKLEVVLNHFSKYVIVNANAKTVTPPANDSNPATGGSSHITFAVVLMGVALIGMISLFAKRKATR